MNNPHQAKGRPKLPYYKKIEVINRLKKRFPGAKILTDRL